MHGGGPLRTYDACSRSVSDYIEAVRELACELLELIAEGLRVRDTSSLSSLITDVESDSVFRLNFYPATSSSPGSKVGFGEHTDPQILTLLRSNDVSGLQISTQDGVWVPVTSDSSAFCVNVIDALQMTNGRFVSVRQSLNQLVQAKNVNGSLFRPSFTCDYRSSTGNGHAREPSNYKSFTWAQYKKKTCSLRLGDSRLNLFRTF